MKVLIKIPSKTFLAGEYLALLGGPALILATKPHFIFAIETVGQGFCQGIHPNSPAGKWIRANKELFHGVDVSFQDPYEGRGGLGASSAQFLGAYLWSQIALKPLFNGLPALLPFSIWDAFQALHEDGVKPSGADVLAQWSGGLCTVQTQAGFSTRTMSWPFANLDFAIVRTGFKINSHEHLRNLQLESLSRLRPNMDKLSEALKNNNSSMFLDCLRDFSMKLDEMGLWAKESKQLAEKLSKELPLATVKGCGALGADTLLLVFPSELKIIVQEVLKSMKLERVAAKDDLSLGTTMEIEISAPVKDLKPSILDNESAYV